MKNIIIILTVLLIGSCCKTKEQKRKMELMVFVSSTNYSTIGCDSLQMISNKNAIVYIDGTAMNIYGNELKPSN